MNKNRMFRIRINCPDWMDYPILILLWVLVVCFLVAVVAVSYLYSWWFLLLLLLLPFRVVRVPAKHVRFEEWKKNQKV